MLQILLADDHPVVRRGMRASLEQHGGWTICAEACTGREAVELARSLRPDLVILDLMMPELNGVEATRQIRRQLPRTEVLIFTFQDSEGLVAEALAAGARGLVLKGDPPEEFIAAVESLAQHRPYFTRNVPQTVVDRVAQKRVQRGGPVSLLTARERQIVQMVAEGHRTRDIAQALGISEKTVETHRAAVMRKLQLESLADVVRFAIRNNIVQP